MPKAVNEDLSKLPAWARKRIENAEAHVNSLVRHIAEISNPHPLSNVSVEGHHVYPDITLPAFSEILFYLGDDRDRWRNTITARLSRERPHVMELRAGDKKLALQPASYNAVEVFLRDDR